MRLRKPLREPADEDWHGHPTDGTAEEDAYRRGFQQGAEEVLRALAHDVPLARLYQWKLELYRWRFSTSHRTQLPPPPADGKRIVIMIAECERCGGMWRCEADKGPELQEGICIECQNDSDIEKPLTFRLPKSHLEAALLDVLPTVGEAREDYDEE